MMKPTNELEVIFKFAQTLPTGWDVLELGSAFPDAKILIHGEVYKTEFEFTSSNFKQHRHDVMGCDIIICWEDDWGEPCPLPVIALSNDNWQETDIKCGINMEKALRYERGLREKLETKVVRLEGRISSLRKRVKIEASDSELYYDTEPCEYCNTPLRVGSDGTTSKAWAGHKRACTGFPPSDEEINED